MNFARSIRLAGLAALVVALGLAAGGPTALSSAADTTMYYVSLGDSYAQGFQPGTVGNSETLNGFSDKLSQLLSSDGHAMTLENFGCGRVNSTTILTKLGCRFPAEDGVRHPTTSQAVAATNFITAHPGQIGLITIAIGINDFDRCHDFERTCIRRTLRDTHLSSNLTKLSMALRNAAGTQVPILAITYPDPFLGRWLHPGHQRHIANRSVQMYRSIINPRIAAGLASANVTVVDITAASSAYVAQSNTQTLAPYGVIPTSVARVCQLTWFCSRGDIHATDAGYALIASTLEQQYLALVTPPA